VKVFRSVNFFFHRVEDSLVCDLNEDTVVSIEDGVIQDMGKRMEVRLQNNYCK
jgi:hypothetical protein